MRNFLALGLLLQWSPLLLNALPTPDYTVTIFNAVGFNEYDNFHSISVVPIGTAADGAVTTYELSTPGADEIATLIQGSAGYTLTFVNGDGFPYTANDECVFSDGVANCHRTYGLFEGQGTTSAGTGALQALATLTVSGSPPGLSSSATGSGASSTHQPSATNTPPSSSPAKPSPSTGEGSRRFNRDCRIGTVYQSRTVGQCYGLDMTGTEILFQSEASKTHQRSGGNSWNILRTLIKLVRFWSLKFETLHLIFVAAEIQLRIRSTSTGGEGIRFRDLEEMKRVAVRVRFALGEQDILEDPHSPASAQYSRTPQSPQLGGFCAWSFRPFTRGNPNASWRCCWCASKSKAGEQTAGARQGGPGQAYYRACGAVELDDG
ncbi:hypothetical protein C8R47DRAFT_1064228 [Mycena vitilis]|nr:hypothetical protein C8R47DRAFT_1064228 [Mycena vitilis]